MVPPPAQRRLGPDDYAQPAPVLAPALLGKFLCRKRGRRVIRLRITETEAYYGEADTACHARRGKTRRTAVMYQSGGYAYVYLCYGVHWMLNVVTGQEGFPEAALIRGVEGFDGPGKLTRALGISKALNGENLAESGRLWIEDDGFQPVCRAGRRVGIDYASETDRNRLWRFTALEKAASLSAPQGSV
ncbi:MAG: DNA-3-methyladenine glycosylase [Treponema sp.]|jgi:DNA-3-methyladenine glycosylase|nr:DNA-3-methyladenine glycosylase [Treponema sp.]